jgi:peptidoglycan/LPS O-acetylase OafA/YrhL
VLIAGVITAHVASTSVIDSDWSYVERGASQLTQLPQMIVMFASGTRAAESGWAGEPMPDGVRRACRRGGVVGLVLLLALVSQARAGHDAAPLLGGLHCQALGLPLTEATTAISVSLLALDCFRRRANRATNVRAMAARGSYAAYLVHPPITVLLSAGLRWAAGPTDWTFVAVALSGVPLTFACGWLLTRVRGGRRMI